MSTVECDCPICPLEAANVNICDLELKILSGKNERLRIEYTNLGEYAQLHKHFAALMLDVKNITKLKIGYGVTFTNKHSKVTIDRLTKNKYKICFHTN